MLENLAFATLVIAISFAVVANSSAQPLLLDGEILKYKIYYAGIPAGFASLRVEQAHDTSEAIFRITSRAQSNEFISLFYEVDDRIVSEFDASRLLPLHFEKTLKEGKHRRHEIIRYTEETDSTSKTVVPGTFDILSALYYIRGEHLEVGKEIPVRVIEGGSSYDAVVKVLRRETVEFGNKTYDCYVIEPEIKEGPFIKEGKILIWLTADHLRLPVLLRSKIAIGNFVAYLIDSHKGGAL